MGPRGSPLLISGAGCARHETRWASVQAMSTPLYRGTPHVCLGRRSGLGQQAEILSQWLMVTPIVPRFGLAALLTASTNGFGPAFASDSPQAGLGSHGRRLTGVPSHLRIAAKRAWLPAHYIRTQRLLHRSIPRYTSRPLEALDARRCKPFSRDSSPSLVIAGSLSQRRPPTPGPQGSDSSHLIARDHVLVARGQAPLSCGCGEPLGFWRLMQRLGCAKTDFRPFASP
jgi:hypothetical protein